MRSAFFDRFPELRQDMMVVDRAPTALASLTVLPVLEDPTTASYGASPLEEQDLMAGGFAGSLGMPDNWFGDMLLSS